MLRELHLYPQWTLRAPVEQPAAIEHVDDVGAGSLAPLRQAQGERESIREQASPASIEAARSIETSTDIPSVQNIGPDVSVSAPFSPATTWPELKQQVRECNRCGLRTGCTRTVFGVGNETADWLFVGEGPGAEEDALGEPFVGQAGRLLDNMLTAIKLARGKQVFIANVVKCRPPDNRNPAAGEVAQCMPYLARQIELIQPKLIVALGKVAANSLLGNEATLASLRGTLHDYRGIPLVVTYHPAYLLRSPSEKAKAWQDLCFAVDVMSKALAQHSVHP
ncbi:MAG: uracil-DNA glycosylase [Gallionella sp.]|nr:uracil-DNA glycosylase [Gallionella sp.]